MKKYIKFAVAITVVLPLLNSCKKFVEVDPRGVFTESNYYKDQTEAFNGLVAAYDILGYQSGNYVTKVSASDAGSDDNYAGGGGSSDVPALQPFSNYSLDAARGPQEDLWSSGFQGVFRTNILLAKLTGVTMSETVKARYVAEAKVLRAYYYFDLVRWFKNVPLMTAPVDIEQAYSIPQVAPALVYAQIEKDLKEAIAESNLPDKVDLKTEAGRMTKGIAHALLGKVYLFEKKYTEAAAELALVNGTPGQANGTYGYQLVADFASLWKASNKFNSESILEIAHTSKSNGTWDCMTCTEGNLLNIMVAPRDYTILQGRTAPDYISGYGILTVTKQAFDAFRNDPRKAASIINLDSLKKAGDINYGESYQGQGFAMAKFSGRVSDRTTGGGEPVLNYPQNMYEIRLADTYLMEAEAIIVGGGNIARATGLITAVRNRAYADGLQHPVAPTLANIMTERHLELAFEGQRWFDLVRWGTAAQVLGFKGFIAGKNEILPVPLLELDNTQIKQSKEYGGSL